MTDLRKSGKSAVVHWELNPSVFSLSLKERHPKKQLVHREGVEMPNTREVPLWVRDRLQPYFIVPLDQILVNPAPSRGGVDAWTWVKNGHSWDEVVAQFARVFESDVTQ